MDELVRVLAVDDSVTIRKALELILAPTGFAVEFATSGGEAIDKARHGAPAVILLDFILPDMRGNEVCRALRDDARTADIPIVLVSARGAEIRQASEDAPNVVRYLTKPFTPHEVITVIHAATEARSATTATTAPPPRADAATEPATANASPTGAVVRDPARVVAAIEPPPTNAVCAPIEPPVSARRPPVSEPARQALVDERPDSNPISADDRRSRAPHDPVGVLRRAQGDRYDSTPLRPEPVRAPFVEASGALRPSGFAGAFQTERPTVIARDHFGPLLERLRAGLEAVHAEAIDTYAGAGAEAATPGGEDASELGAQLADALRRAESGSRHVLRQDGSIRSLGDMALDAYRRVCRLLFRAAAAGTLAADDAGDARPRVLVVCRAESPVAALLEGAVRDAGDWHALRIASDFRQIPMTVCLFGPTHLLVEATQGEAIWQQLRILRALPHTRPLAIIGVVPADADGADPSLDLERLREVGVTMVVAAGPDLAGVLRSHIGSMRAAA